MTDGYMLTYDFPSLELIDSKRVFNCAAVTSIEFEPTKFIFVGSEAGEMIALTFINQRTHYMYLELGRKRYCTIKLPKKKNANTKKKGYYYNNEPD
mmetsp:Transcript_8992/g.8348  ORF Transcript_8992/g.8348 Transcript_8992/m.8348 type:complete len:96 (+) Transcript_8992:217-504(+)